MTQAVMDMLVSKKPLNDYTHKELMGLPVRAWDKDSEYESLLIVSTKKKHDSKWAIMAIIGVMDFQPVEIAAACCDDIEWKLPPMETYGIYTAGQFRMDCAFRSGAVHAWGRNIKFKVGCALSSITIEVIKQAIAKCQPEEIK